MTGEKVVRLLVEAVKADGSKKVVIKAVEWDRLLGVQISPMVWAIWGMSIITDHRL